MSKWLGRILDKNVPLSTFKVEAAGWLTCAVGETNDAVPNVVVRSTYNGTPRDAELDRLGMNFFRAVDKNQRAAAMRAYQAIQRRVATLAGIRA